jgi:hypothetical protein
VSSRYSDDRLFEVVVCRPGDETPLYRIVTRRTHLRESIEEEMRDRRRIHETNQALAGSAAAQ